MVSNTLLSREWGFAQGFDALVCYGGDGTAMEIAAGAVGSGIPLGLVAGLPYLKAEVVYADEKPARLSDAQQRLIEQLAQLYGGSPSDVKWRQSFKAMGDGPSG